ncbi:TetR/AcrR family transcriptional regulator [Streptomyces sp. NBC_01020]|uniref:TetR/AcrR family transcriptional regulator n=1 Tax=unclassified Streptomyces TaxID=2593676 RepID=UPI00224DF594|nr:MULTISPECIES: TetR/AcrR family transcriptional regulator [unclassified Streptomyces]MCX4728925.1 TetR/AcrR family transcriptional regulator [Streptomyces sp. NBC_01306]WSV08269.1 TetR/AcrR family transcriptional regulator [Streptomyces sp. NBC_01020]WSX65573.1 TetR/AcrR family transcriptional regulator [Streptomyces sp. NBC_00932]
MNDGPTTGEAAEEATEERPRQPVRADAQRSIDALLAAAAEVFSASGVDAPVRQITARAGVGAGTLYRHFPQRSDLIAAVFRKEVDACAAAAPALAAEHEPVEALTRWLQRFAGFIATKRGLSAALHSGDPAYDSLPSYFQRRFEPALGELLDSAAKAGEVRSDANPWDLLRAIGNLTVPVGDDNDGHTQRMIALLVDGLRYGTSNS